MEKKKLLLVAVSVGVFLVIIIGASIIMITRQDNQQVAAVTPISPGMSGTYTMPNTAPGVPATPGMPVNPGSPLNPPVHPAEPEGPASFDPTTALRNPDDMNSLKPAPEGKAPTSINHYYGETYNSPNVIIEKYVPETGPRPADTPKVPAAATPAASRPAAAPAPAAAPKATAPAAAPPKTTAAPKPPAKTYTDYWVQTGSFSTKARADGVKENLAAKGISSVIEIRDVDSKTWYRVRVGPYTSQNEAEYWLSLIKSINGFEESQIWRSQSTR